MLAYHPYWIEASKTSREAARWLDSNLITSEQCKIIKAAFITPLYTPNVFERVVFFIFTATGVAGMLLFVTQILNTSHLGLFHIPLVLAGIFCFVILELLIKTKKIYRAGIDDALLYAGLFFTIGGTLLYLNTVFAPFPLLAAGLIALPFFLVTTTRYTDKTSAVASFICFIYIICVLFLQSHPSTNVFLPLLIMLLTGAGYFLFRRIKTEKRLASWSDSFNVLEVASLLLFYCAGNYYCIQQFLQAIFDEELLSDSTLNMESFYLTTTLLVPITYIVFGLVKRNRVLLRVGLFVEILSLIAFRYYFHAIALEHALVLLGISLILLVIVAIQFLKSAENGFTHAQAVHLLPERAGTQAVTFYDRLAVQEEAVKAFESGEDHLRARSASLGW